MRTNVAEAQSLVVPANDRGSDRRSWRDKARFFHEEDERYLRYLVPPGSSVLEIGCGIGDTLSSLVPATGVGIDVDADMIDEARRSHPNLSFIVADALDESQLAQVEGTFDFIVVVDTLGFVDDCQKLLENLHRFCRRDTRIILAYYSHLWTPLLALAEWTGFRQSQPQHNVLSAADTRNFARLAELDPVKSEVRLLCPLRLRGLGRVINRFLGPLPVIRQFALRHYTICRSQRAERSVRSATIVIPARNERGNIEAAVQRTPQFCDDLEIIFIEGHSQDGTFDEMERVKAAFPDKDIKVMRQPGKGKADAVFTAFDVARGDVLFILDADLTMPPEQLPKFWKALVSGQGEFINGSRLVYPMEQGAMRFLNLIANRTFSLLFSWLLAQRITDTLCGTKVLRRSDYTRLKSNRAYYGDFDPFGDFDLIFGASKLGLKFIDVPIKYAARTYGETQISRFSHGFMLLRMVIFAFFKIKAL
jgi:SAM-dependent methyltransferase